MTKEKATQASDISEEEQEYLERTALLGLEYVLADFVREFQAATKRWERIAFPAMIIFSFLAISGFWLIYSITEDMHRMSESIDPKMAQHLGDMSENIATLTQYINHMDANISNMSGSIANMDKSIGVMQGDIAYMSGNIAQMNNSIYAMTWNTGIMSKDISRLNQSIGKPMRFMNNFLP